MSVADVSPDGRIEILHKVVGKGTARLAALRPGDRLGVLGPLGKPFTVPAAPQPSARALMVAGGIGIAIFPFLVPALKRAGWRGTLLYGGRTAADLVERDRFSAAGVEVLTATEDGSHGRRGLVTALLDEILASPGADRIAYACGPTPMLRAVAQRVVAVGMPTQLSLEAAMGCGIGACLGCVVKVARPGGSVYARICQEGPTFEAAEVRWE
jgi:dihydroorotate dehydrogenase electron transfer subunit